MHDSVTARKVIDELLPERLERLRRASGVPVVFGGATRGPNLVLDRLVGTFGDSLRGLAVQPGRGLGGRVLRQRMPLRVNDYATTLAITHEYDHMVVDAERLTSLVAVPVLVYGEVRSVIYGAVRDHYPIGDRALRTATIVASQLQQDVEQRLDDAARPVEALAELAAIIEHTDDPRLRARLSRIHRDLSERPVRTEATPTLAPREIDTLRLVEVGASNLEIATRLGLSPETVKAYLRSAMRKLGVHNRTAAAHRARATGNL